MIVELSYYGIWSSGYPGTAENHGILCNGETDVPVTFKDRPIASHQVPNSAADLAADLSYCRNDRHLAVTPCEGHDDGPSRIISLADITNVAVRASFGQNP